MLLGQPLRFCDAASVLSAYRSIYENGIYAFDTAKIDPVILDCGANVGLAVLYWKQRYPHAHITAFEADPNAFALLKLNCSAFAPTDVALVNKAVWVTNEVLPFVGDGADGGHIDDTKHEAIGGNQTVFVESMRLRDYLCERSVDLLKLDIEGAEVDVLIDCRECLEGVQRVFVEYHSFVNRSQRLDEVISVLRGAGFRYHVQPEWVAARPFQERVINGGMDNRLNIFGYRL
jgi:FkbM family methyltransferase